MILLFVTQQSFQRLSQNKQCIPAPPYYCIFSLQCILNELASSGAWPPPSDRSSHEVALLVLARPLCGLRCSLTRRLHGLPTPISPTLAQCPLARPTLDRCSHLRQLHLLRQHKRAWMTVDAGGSAGWRRMAGRLDDTVVAGQRRSSTGWRWLNGWLVPLKAGPMVQPY
jgi:hypothetical protein